jgi:hypothetical protein
MVQKPDEEKWMTETLQKVINSYYGKELDYRGDIYTRVNYR